MSVGADLNAYVEKLGWTINESGVVTVPPNPDNQIESTVVQENIQLPRTSSLNRPLHFSIADPVSRTTELTKVIAHAAQTSLPVVPAVN